MTREEAIQVLNMVEAHGLADEAKRMAIEALTADTVSREFYEDAVKANLKLVIENRKLKEQIESADAEPKWNCTANFVAEQLDRLKNMTDEEKWEFFKRFFEIKGGDDE